YILFIRFLFFYFFFFFQAEDGIRDGHVTGVQTCALPIYSSECFSKQSENNESGEPIGIAAMEKHSEEFLVHHCKEARLPRRQNRSEERRVGKECRSRWSRYH